MRTLLIFTIVFVYVVSVCNAEATVVPATESNEPAIQSDETANPVNTGETTTPGLSVDATEFDFGEVFWGQKTSHIFTISNRSEKPVAIINLRADCGCTAVLSDDAPIQPGESRQLTVEYEPEYREGEIKKRVTVYTDAKSESDPSSWFEVNLKGKITSVLSFEPPHVYFKKVYFGQSSEESILIRADRGINVDVVRATSSSENLEAFLEAGAVSEKENVRQWQLKLKLRETAPVGAFTGTVTIHTDHASQREIALNVLAFVRGPITLAPTQCYLGTLVPGQSIEKKFTIEKTGENPALQLPTVSSAPDWLTASVETVSEQQKYSITISVTVPNDAIGRLSGKFNIETGDANTPLFEVPVFGYVLPETQDKKIPEAVDSGT